MDGPPPGAVRRATSAGKSADKAQERRTCEALDGLIHAAEARATLGLSRVAQSLAFLDWAAHLANAPFRRLELAHSALQQWRRLFEEQFQADWK